MNTEDYIKKIWDMLDNPQAYSEEEILALLRDNEEASEAYRQIVEVKRSYRQLHAADKFMLRTNPSMSIRRGSVLPRGIRWKTSGIGRNTPVGLQVRESMPPLASQC